jgi:hypothetical protein
MSECDAISVASMSMMIRSGAAPAAPARARARARLAHGRPQRGVARDLVDHPKHRRVGRHRTKQRPLVADRPQVRKAVAAVGEHHRQVADDAPGIVPAAPLTHPRQAARQRPGRAEPVGRLGQQPCARVRHQARSVRADLYRQLGPIALHPSR